MALYSKEQPPASWENWPTAGGTRNGSLFQRPTWAPATGGSDGSASHGGEWMTPSTSSPQKEYTRDNGAEGRERLALVGQASQWATPEASMSKRGDRAEYLTRNPKAGSDLVTEALNWPIPTGTDGGANSNRSARSNVGANLPEVAQQWPTPMVRDHHAQGAGNQQKSPSLGTVSARWPTPTVQDSKQAGGAGMIGRGRSETLNHTATLWPTPASRDYRSPNAQSYEDRGGATKGEQLQNYVAHHFSSLPAQPTPDGPPSSPPRLGFAQLCPVHLMPVASTPPSASS